MKAIVWTRYGSPDVLQLQEVEKPAPKANEVLIKIQAATVSAGDCEARSLKFPLWIALPMRLYIGLLKPTRTVILGQELAGVVEAVGQDVTRFKPGDEVFGTTGLNFGAYAEYICLPAQSADLALAIKPATLTFEEAAAAPTGGLEALHFLKQANIQPRDQLLVNGAGGMIGTFAVQLAKHFGAEVTAVDSAEKLDMLRSIGADHVIDYTREDFSRGGAIYDIIFDVVGKNSFARSIKSLKPDGRYLLANPTLSTMLRGLWISRTTHRKVINAFSGRNPDDILVISDRLAAGKIKTVIDRRFPLAQAAEAHRYVETGVKQGNVVLTVAQS